MKTIFFVVVMTLLCSDVYARTVVWIEACPTSKEMARPFCEEINDFGGEPSRDRMKKMYEKHKNECGETFYVVVKWELESGGYVTDRFKFKKYIDALQFAIFMQGRFIRMGKGE